MTSLLRYILNSRDRNLDIDKFITWLDYNRLTLLELDEIQINNAYNAGVQDSIMERVKINDKYYTENYNN